MCWLPVMSKASKMFGEIKTYSIISPITLIQIILIVRGHQSSHSSCSLRVRYLKQTWSRGHNVRGQGLKKNSRPKLRTDFPSSDPLEAKDRIGRGQSQGPRTKF